MNKSKNTLKWGSTAVCALVLAGCNLESDSSGSESAQITQRSQLVGGSTSVCSSVGQSACNDWNAWWAANGEADAKVAVALSEPVALSEQKIATLVNDPSWETDPDFKTGVELILDHLRDQILDEGIAEYPDWEDFRSAFIAVAHDDVEGLPEGIDGDVIWFDSSSAQYGTFEGLKKADERLNYEITANNSASIASLVAGLPDTTLTEEQKTISTVIDGLISPESRSLDDLLAALASVELENENQSEGIENGLQLWNSLPSLVRFKLLEILLIELEDYERPIEYTSVADTTNRDAIAIYQAFVDQAREAANDEAPHILVMTSSAADSYAAADYYVGIFEQLGATAQWLPVDRAYRKARDANQCDWLAAYHADFAAVPHLDQLYPDYFQAHLQACEQGVAELIENAHGVFINGGDQVRSFDALVSFESEQRIDSAELQLIKNRQQDGRLIVGGTSAGAAVQSGGLADNGNTNPMITAGSSHGILVNGFDSSNHEATGGIQSFPWGVVDTHFSERAREGRLIRLLAHADVRFGFGIDETTALNVATIEADDEEPPRVEMQVTGENGVYIVDMASAHILQQTPFEVRDVVTHYLNDGDRFILYPETGEYEIEFAEGGTALEVGSDTESEVTNDDVLYQDNYRSMATEMMTTGASEATGTSYENDPEYSVTLSLDDDTAAQTKDGKVSYRNLKVEFLQDGSI